MERRTGSQKREQIKGGDNMDFTDACYILSKAEENEEYPDTKEEAQEFVEAFRIAMNEIDMHEEEKPRIKKIIKKMQRIVEDWEKE